MKLRNCTDVFSQSSCPADRRNSAFTRRCNPGAAPSRQNCTRAGSSQIHQQHLPIYLDLESERDRAKLAQPELYLVDHLDKLVILDEVHRASGLFPVLRGLIDQARRSGKRSGQYLLLGSASLGLLQQSGETLAGRIAYLELGPLNILLNP